MSFSAWTGSYFNSAQMADSAISGPNATPQNAGIPNLLKYFCNIDPTRAMTAADRAALPTQGMTADGQNQTLTYRRYAYLVNVTATVQSAADLNTWTTPANATPATIGTDSITGDPIVQVLIPVTGSRQLVRLNVVGS